MLWVSVAYIFICVLLVVFVLLQQSAGGMGLLGGSSDSILGSTAGNVLTRSTAILALIFIVGAISLGIMASGDSSGLQKGLEEAEKKQQENSLESSGVNTNLIQSSLSNEVSSNTIPEQTQSNL